MTFAFPFHSDSLFLFHSHNVAQAVYKAVSNWEFGAAVNMALHLGEKEVLKKAVDSVKVEAIELVVKSVDARMLKDLLKFIADEIVSVLLRCVCSVYCPVANDMEGLLVLCVAS